MRCVIHDIMRRRIAINSYCQLLTINSSNKIREKSLK